MSDKFLSAPKHRADVSATYGAPARRVEVVEAPITDEQRAALESWRKPSAFLGELDKAAALRSNQRQALQPRTFQRVGHVVCCTPTRPDMPARNGRGSL